MDVQSPGRFGWRSARYSATAVPCQGVCDAAMLAARMYKLNATVMPSVNFMYDPACLAGHMYNSTSSKYRMHEKERGHLSPE